MAEAPAQWATAWLSSRADVMTQVSGVCEVQAQSGLHFLLSLTAEWEVLSGLWGAIKEEQ